MLADTSRCIKTPVLAENTCFQLISVEGIEESLLFVFLLTKWQDQHPCYKKVNKMRTATSGCGLGECAPAWLPAAPGGARLGCSPAAAQRMPAKLSLQQGNNLPGVLQKS